MRLLEKNKLLKREKKLSYDMPDSYENMDVYYFIERIDGSKVAKR